jgi:hypothetical protein
MILWSSQRMKNACDQSRDGRIMFGPLKPYLAGHQFQKNDGVELAVCELL